MNAHRHAADGDEPAPRLLGPAEIRDLAELLDVTPTKKLGQNFVHDGNTVRRMAMGVHALVSPMGTSSHEPYTRSVFAATCAQSSSRSAPSTPAMNRIVCGTR